MKVISNLNAIAIAVVLLLITGIGATVFIAPAYAGPKWVPVVPTTGDVTGVWLGNDGGTYYLRQIGDVVWWVGLSGGNDGRTYSNIFRGTMTTQSIDNEIKVINGEFVDIPRGALMNSGKLLLHVSNPTTILKISGGFGTEKWSKLISGVEIRPSLTGVWQASDGGTYYLRQIGSNVWWNGMSGGNDGRSFNNIFTGVIKWPQQGLPRISGEWIDVPRGTVMSSGSLDLEIRTHTTLQIVSQTGGFGAKTWQKVNTVCANAPLVRPPMAFC